MRNSFRPAMRRSYSRDRLTGRNPLTSTAENHRARVLEKLGARNTAEVVRYAVRKGLLDK